jgi:general secretion pathway protein C
MAPRGWRVHPALATAGRDLWLLFAVLTFTPAPYNRDKYKSGASFGAGYSGDQILSAQWLSSSSEYSERAAALVGPLLQRLGQPERLRRLRQVLVLLLLMWALLALVRLVWALLPQAETPPLPVKVINPVAAGASDAPQRDLDIQRMRDWHLFGEAGEAPVIPVEKPVVESGREGIEKDARETRLALKLRGVVASTRDGLGHAIIEYKSKQAVYAVEDKLPLPGRVSLAKVMPRQVILDNGGTYERLVLFEESELDTAVSASRPAPGNAAALDHRGRPDITAMASEYRERLYQDPQSLAEVVNVSAVRVGGSLVGYRLAPGRDSEQFEQLGFKPGDLVTGVNGIALDSPANTMKLYNAMRSAGEVVFDLKRNDQEMTLSVSLGEAGP